MLKKIYEHFEEIFVCSFFILMFILLVMGVVLRYLFSISFAWNIELSRYSFVWLTFIGAAYVRRNDGHIKIELFSNYLKKKLPQIWVTVYWVATRLIIIAYIALLVYLSYQLSVRTWRFRSQAMQIPQSFLFMSAGLGALMYLVREIIDSVRKFIRKEF